MPAVVAFKYKVTQRLAGVLGKVPENSQFDLISDEFLQHLARKPVDRIKKSSATADLGIAIQSQSVSYLTVAIRSSAVWVSVISCVSLSIIATPFSVFMVMVVPRFLLFICRE